LPLGQPFSDECAQVARYAAIRNLALRINPENVRRRPDAEFPSPLKSLIAADEVEHSFDARSEFRILTVHDREKRNIARGADAFELLDETSATEALVIQNRHDPEARTPLDQL
jgi:hypothetical protein